MLFEKASRIKLRFESGKGNLTVEDLWDLSLQQLNKLAKGLHKLIKEDVEEDFLEEKSSEDTILKLKFDIVLHILNVKKEEQKARKEATTKRAEKERLLGILERKQHEADENLTEEQLKEKIAGLS